MTERFAAPNEKYTGRNRGVRVGTIWYNASEGDVTIFPRFDELPAIIQCDILSDALAVLVDEYAQARMRLHQKMRTGK